MLYLAQLCDPCNIVNNFKMLTWLLKKSKRTKWQNHLRSILLYDNNYINFTIGIISLNLRILPYYMVISIISFIILSIYSHYSCARGWVRNKRPGIFVSKSHALTIEFSTMKNFDSLIQVIGRESFTILIGVSRLQVMIYSPSVISNKLALLVMLFPCIIILSE